MKHLIVGFGIEISDTRHVQGTLHVLQHKNANIAIALIKLIVPITDPKIIAGNSYFTMM